MKKEKKNIKKKKKNFIRLKFYQSVKISHNRNRPYILDHPCRIFIIGASGSGKTNALLKLIKHQRPDIDKIYLYIKDPFKSNINCLLMKEKK